MPYAGQNPRRIALDFHPSATAVPLLATPEFPVHEIQRNAQPGGQAGEKSDKRLPVRFPRREVFEHLKGL
jgi:hypothetical protein